MRRALLAQQTLRKTQRMVTLVTFDIDGTIIHSKALKDGQESNSLHKQALHHGAKAAADVDVHVREVEYHGCTDMGIVKDMLELRGVTATDAILAQAMKVASTFGEDEDWAHSIELLPGVETLLKRLSETDDVCVALVTGNVEEIAWRKMDSLDVGGLFSKPRFGGFGGYFRRRAECVQHANKVAKERHGDITRSFHIGDAPADISAATESHVTPIGVLTGKFTKDELHSAATDGKAPAIFADLSDTETVLKLILG